MATASPPRGRVDDLPVQIGRYRVDRLLGRGGVGTVVLATDVAIQRQVAIKLLQAQGAEAEERFLTEVRAAGHLNHPNVASMFDVGRTETGQIFVVQEYVQGIDLGRVLAAHPQGLPLSVAVHLLVQVASALAHAHDRGILHRDVKPGNVAVTPSGQVKLLDFGVARIEHADTATTSPGTIVGTPQYMAPEQIRGEAPTPSVDIFSFGVLAFEMISGKKPFAADDFMSTILAVTQQPVPRLQHADGTGFEALFTLVERCMAKLPSERPSPMVEVVSLLGELPSAWDAAVLAWASSASPAAPMTTTTQAVPFTLPTAPQAAAAAGLSSTTVFGAPGASAAPTFDFFGGLGTPSATASLRSTEDMSGQTLGRFVLHERVARGKSGDLYKAWDPVRSTLVGVKVVHARDAVSRERLLRGGRVWLGLNHPHIVKVYDVHPDYGGVAGVIVTELVDGLNLDELVAQRRLDLNQMVYLTLQVCDALAAIHALNVVHREVKPRNILVARERLHVTLLDSGIARHTNPELSNFTQTGIFVADLAYAAPEQARGRADQRSDIYAVAAVLYELVTQSKLPFPLPNTWAPDAAAMSALPQRLQLALQRGLMADPAARFASINELHDQLRPLVSDSGLLPQQDPSARAANALFAGPGSSAPQRSVVALHGINTHAAWQRMFSEVAHRHGVSAHVDRWNFGHFSVLRFLMPGARMAKVRWFRETYQQEFRESAQAGALPSIVAHSFGTYILGNALLRYPSLRLDKVLLCGSILPQNFPWPQLIERGQVQALRNEYGREDVWTQAVGWFVAGTGPSGLRAFNCTHPRLSQERFEFEHSEYFERGHMDKHWLPFLTAQVEQRPLRELQIEPPPAQMRPWGLYALYAVLLWLLWRVVWPYAQALIRT